MWIAYLKEFKLQVTSHLFFLWEMIHISAFFRVFTTVCHTQYYQEVTCKDCHEKIELDTGLLIEYLS